MPRPSTSVRPASIYDLSLLCGRPQSRNKQRDQRERALPVLKVLSINWFPPFAEPDITRGRSNTRFVASVRRESSRRQTIALESVMRRGPFRRKDRRLLETVFDILVVKSLHICV